MCRRIKIYTFMKRILIFFILIAIFVCGYLLRAVSYLDETPLCLEVCNEMMMDQKMVDTDDIPYCKLVPKFIECLNNHCTKEVETASALEEVEIIKSDLSYECRYELETKL